MGDNSLCLHFLDDNILHTTDALTTHAHIDLRDLGLQRRLQLLDDVGQTHNGLVNVVDHTLANARRGVFLNDSEDGNAAVEILFSCDTGYLRRTEFYRYDKLLWHNYMIFIVLFS